VLVLAATVGSVVGALVLYGVAHAIGEARVRRLVERFGKWITIGQDDVDRAEQWFDRHGRSVVFFGRLVPIVRSLVSLPAGWRRMPLGQFVLYTAAGSAIWNGALVGFGWFLGDRWEEVGGFVSALQNLVIVLGAAAVAWFLWKRRPWQQWRSPAGS
jgi:membrane protein DedA with SNARE-associated domain